MSEITREEFLHALLEEKFVDYQKVINYTNQLEARIKELERQLLQFENISHFMAPPKPPEEEEK